MRWVRIGIAGTNSVGLSSTEKQRPSLPDAPITEIAQSYLAFPWTLGFKELQTFVENTDPYGRLPQTQIEKNPKP